jgi:hypothetical protein
MYAKVTISPEVCVFSIFYVKSFAELIFYLDLQPEKTKVP